MLGDDARLAEITNHGRSPLLCGWCGPQQRRKGDVFHWRGEPLVCARIDGRNSAKKAEADAWLRLFAFPAPGQTFAAANPPARAHGAIGGRSGRMRVAGKEA